MSQERAVAGQTRRPTLLRRVSRDTLRAAIERSLDGEPGVQWLGLLERKTQMHREDLMNADMLSETLLLVSGTMIVVTLLLILVAALTRTAALT
jgi:hypothetical protein